MTDEKQPIRQTSVNLEEFQVASAPPGSLQDAALEKAIPAGSTLAVNTFTKQAPSVIGLLKVSFRGTCLQA